MIASCSKKRGKVRKNAENVRKNAERFRTFSNIFRVLRIFGRKFRTFPRFFRVLTYCWSKISNLSASCSKFGHFSAFCSKFFRVFSNIHTFPTGQLSNKTRKGSKIVRKNAERFENVRNLSAFCAKMTGVSAFWRIFGRKFRTFPRFFRVLAYFWPGFSNLSASCSKFGFFPRFFAQAAKIISYVVLISN